jgi:hypothetical protein
MSMSCTEFRESHPAASAGSHAHAASCADCREFARAWELLKDYPAIEASTGFFRAIRRKLAPRILRFAAALSAAAAAVLVAVVLWHTPAAKPEIVTDEERELVENLDLLQNYELLKTLELVGENGSSGAEERK